jgi:Luciferase-like monooxygenase
MTARLALGLIPGTGWRAAEIKDVARAAEDAGFEAVFCAEVNSNALATAQSMGEASHRIKVGTWAANIYLRPPYICAKSAAFAADATNGRFVLGLGVSHQPRYSGLRYDALVSRAAKIRDDNRTFARPRAETALGGKLSDARNSLALLTSIREQVQLIMLRGLITDEYFRRCCEEGSPLPRICYC